MILITKKSSLAFVKREFGGKGLNLYLMSAQDLPVPEWVGISARAFEQFKKETRIDTQIQEIVKSAERSGSFAQASEEIKELIVSVPFPVKLLEQIEACYAALFPENSSGLFSVRSSAADEDGSKHSFAGQLSSYLYVEGKNDALKFIKECWASGYTERGLVYRTINGLSLDKPIQVAVILQRMICADKSGVMFTIDPVSQDASLCTISSVYGIGEGIVSGILDADTFVLKKSDGTIKSQEIAEKPTRLVRGSSGATKEEAVLEKDQLAKSLTEDELFKLANLCKKIESIYSLPQDVEFAILNGEVFILQARPITTLTRNPSGQLYIWDNSNIIESYGGITLPLTFTFASYVYREVYLQLCDILLVPKPHIEALEHSLKNMLGSHYGRVYYNLLNWYKLLTIVPGFKQNRSFMETMMGVGETLSDEVAARCRPPESGTSLFYSMTSKLRKIASGFKLLYFHFRAQQVVDSFLKNFTTVYHDFRKRPYSSMASDAIYESYKELENKLLRKWHAPIINDMLCMIHFGLLKKLTAKWLSEHGDSLQNDLLCGEGNIESAEPTKYLIRLAATAGQDPVLKKLIENTAAVDLLDVLSHSSFSEFYESVQVYIDKYGFRCMSEMKLEQPDLHQQPAFLFTCLKNYLKQGDISLEAFEAREQRIRSLAEEKVQLGLFGIKRMIYKWSLKHARRAVRNRENTRFCRTRVYGVVRQMFYSMGDDFVLRNMLDKADDIFFLSLQEVTGIFDGTCTVQDLRALIDLRRSEYKKFEEIEPSARFMTRGPVYWHNPPHPTEVESEDVSSLDSLTHLGSNALKGTGCCPGVVEGVVKVILNPQDSLDLNGEILVTLRTDPGWIPLYPAASALLVERGSLLSHSAIVAREMGLPTIVSIKGLTSRLKSGMRVRIDGTTGLIEIQESGLD